MNIVTIALILTFVLIICIWSFQIFFDARRKQTKDHNVISKLCDVCFRYNIYFEDIDEIPVSLDEFIQRLTCEDCDRFTAGSTIKGNVRLYDNGQFFANISCEDRDDILEMLNSMDKDLKECKNHK